jgi:hypothetical protein
MLELPDRACWDASSADAILQTEALAGRDALFLATHTSLRGFHRAGMRATDIADSTEEALLAALSHPNRQHAFCVVQGEPGSGKSHLIRWLEVNWPRTDDPEKGDLVLLLQRADGSLDGALNQLKLALGEQFAPLFQGLGKRQKVSVEGRAADFRDGLANRMKSSYYDGKAPEDADWCDSAGLATLFQNIDVRNHWTGPRRLLDIMDGASGERNSESASFDLRDMENLAKHCHRVADSAAAQLTARRLVQEAEALETFREEGLSWADIEAQQAASLPVSLKVCAALNRRRNDAVEFIIGVTASDLQKLFHGVRGGLQAEGRRMVLLLEDITSWEGLDDRLIDALVTDATTRPKNDLCALISVVGVTPKYYRDLYANYQQRITHEIRLGDDDGALQDVASMRQAEGRWEFVARYLNATRAGEAKLTAWRDDYKTDHSLPPPNACVTCPFQAPCHATFGEVEGMGLYPFSPNAIDALFFALKTDDGGQTHRTPRGVLQHILAPTLLDPTPLNQRVYPSSSIQVLALERESFVLPGALRSILESQVDDRPTRDRLQRIFAIWGDKNKPSTERDENGGLYFAGVSSAILQTFGLPWLGSENDAATEGTPVTDPLREDSSSKDTSDDAFEEAPVVFDSADASETPKQNQLETGTTNDRDKPPPTTVNPKPRRSPTPAMRVRPPSDIKLGRLRDHIQTARVDGVVVEPNLWNETLALIVRRISPRRLGLDRWTFDRFFTSELIKLEGTGAERSRRHFFVPKDDALFDGLEAYCELRLGEQTDVSTQDYYRRRQAFLIRRIEVLAAGHASARLPRNADGHLWSLIGGLTQVLAARAWLRGAARPTDPLHIQFRDILSDERTAAGDPKSRSAGWREVLTASDPWHGQFREFLQAMLDTPQGDTRDTGFMDAGVAAIALKHLIENRLQLFATGQSPGGKSSIEKIDDILSVSAVIAAKLPAVPRQELTRLTERAANLDEVRFGSGLKARIDRIDAAIDTVGSKVPSAPGLVQQEWKTDRAALNGLLADAEAIRAVELLVSDLQDPTELPTGPGLLEWLVVAPAADLQSLRDLLVLRGQAVLEALLTVTRDHVERAEGGVDLSPLHAAGVTLSQAAQEAQILLDKAAT